MGTGSATRHPLECIADAENFDEASYLRANPDVATAVRAGVFASGRALFVTYGQAEGRRQRHISSLRDAKAKKLARIGPTLRHDLAVVVCDDYLDFLTVELRRQFNIIDTEAVSSNSYDEHALSIIDAHADGLVLDCGAGRRDVYFDNVVNFEIAPYDTTDVRGVGEVLPFRDESFDAVLSIAVLEHVKDPFLCAREIVRVLKPGGSLMCGVPFLQPLHGYPHHYYNMTHQGLRNLFDHALSIDRVECYASVLPIWALTWILSEWVGGLSGKTKDDFLDMRVRDLLSYPAGYLSSPFVTELSVEKNLQLASGTVLFAQKPKNGALRDGSRQ